MFEIDMTRRTTIAGLAILFSTLAFGLWARSSGDSKALSESRSAADLAPREGRLVVDIREPDEWKDTGVLPGARLHSWRSAEGLVAALGKDLEKADEILIVCRSGNRSSRAARALADHLDREVIDVAGGMIRLAREGQAKVVAPTRKMGGPVC